MRVKLFLQRSIEDYIVNHANGKRHFLSWLKSIKEADWNEPADITKVINGNLLGRGSNRVIFDVGGNGQNAFRIICQYKFNCPHSQGKIMKVHLYINWVGTHEEYNRLSDDVKRTIEMY